MIENFLQVADLQTVTVNHPLLLEAVVPDLMAVHRRIAMAHLSQEVEDEEVLEMVADPQILMDHRQEVVMVTMVEEVQGVEDLQTLMEHLQEVETEEGAVAEVITVSEVADHLTVTSHLQMEMEGEVPGVVPEVVDLQIRMEHHPGVEMEEGVMAEATAVSVVPEGGGHLTLMDHLQAVMGVVS